MEKHLSEPWFTYISFGIKTVEGRPASGSFGKMKEGDVIVFYNDDSGVRRICTVVIIKITRHSSFENMIKAHSLKNVLPGYRSIKQGVEQVYEKHCPNCTGEVLGIVLRVI